MKTVKNFTPAKAFSHVTQSTTFGELKRMLPGTGKERVPGITQLREKAVVVLHAKTESGVIEVYDNGFYTYKENGHSTVFAVDRCTVLKWHSCIGEESTTDGENLDTLPWPMPLEIAGANRIEDSYSVIERRHQLMYLDDPASSNNILFSVRPEHEIREEAESEEDYRKGRILLMREALQKLTSKQKEILILFHLKNMTQEEISETLGISRRTVREHLWKAEKKIKDFFKNTRHFVH